MKRLMLCLCAATLVVAHAGMAQAAPPCGTSTYPYVSGIADDDVVATGHTTTRLGFNANVSNVTASVPAPGRASVTPVSGRAVDLVLDLPAAGSITLTLTWDQVPDDDPFGTPCTVTDVIHFKAVHPARVVPVTAAAGISSPVVGGTFRWGFICRDRPLVGSPLTITMRYRVGPRRPPRPVPPPVTAAPSARSPKLTLTLPNACGTAKGTTVRSGGVLARLGGVDQASELTATVYRSFAGRGTYSAHMLVTFSQPGFKTLRYDVRGYAALGDYGRVADTKFKRLS